MVALTCLVTTLASNIEILISNSLTHCKKIKIKNKKFEPLLFETLMHG